MSHCGGPADDLLWPVGMRTCFWSLHVVRSSVHDRRRESGRGNVSQLVEVWSSSTEKEGGRCSRSRFFPTASKRGDLRLQNTQTAQNKHRKTPTWLPAGWAAPSLSCLLTSVGTVVVEHRSEDAVFTLMLIASVQVFRFLLIATRWVRVCERVCVW